MTLKEFKEKTKDLPEDMKLKISVTCECGEYVDCESPILTIAEKTVFIGD